MSGIFISYRRSDSAYVVDRIYESLLPRFGHMGVFKDVDSIALGEDFRHKIAEAVQDCDVLIAVIGEEWGVASDGDGQRRLDNPDDFVRIEIEAALERDIPLIPVLVDDAPIPPPSELPPSLSGLSFRSAAKLRPAPDFDADITRLSDAIAKQLGIPLEEGALRSPKRRKLLYGAVLVISLVAIALFLSPYLRRGISAEAFDTALNDYHDKHAKHVYSELSDPETILEMVKTIEDYVPDADRLDVFRELTEKYHHNYFPEEFNTISGIPDNTPGPESLTLISWLKLLEKTPMEHELSDGTIERPLTWWLLYVGFHHVIKRDKVVLIQMAKIYDESDILSLARLPLSEQLKSDIAEGRLSEQLKRAIAEGPLSEQLQKAIAEGEVDDLLEFYEFNPKVIKATQLRGSTNFKDIIVDAYRDWLNGKYDREATANRLRKIMLDEIKTVTKQMSISKE